VQRRIHANTERFNQQDIGVSSDENRLILTGKMPATRIAQFFVLWKAVTLNDEILI
jgi:hypothetical protein